MKLDSCRLIHHQIAFMSKIYLFFDIKKTKCPLLIFTELHFIFHRGDPRYFLKNRPESLHVGIADGIHHLVTSPRPEAELECLIWNKDIQRASEGERKLN